MNEPKVSIIIPVYNTAEYVRQAVESIAKQTLREIEIIVVNDGSTDGSLQILQELAGKDSRIQVYSQENKGQSVARNNGVQHATGQYLYFMDSDDLLEADALELCYKKCEEQKLNFVFFDAESFSQNSTKFNNNFDYKHSKILSNRIYEGIEILNIQLQQYEFRAPVWLTFINKQFCAKHGLQFYPGIIHEDQLFTALLYIQADKVGYIDRSLFKRRIRPNSTMIQKFGWKNIKGYLTVADELLSYQKQIDEKGKRTINIFLTQMLDAAIWQAHVMSTREKIKLFFICRKKKYKRFISLRTLVVLFLKRKIKHETTQSKHTSTYLWG